MRQGRITVWLLQALTGIMTYQRFWPELFFALSLVLAGILLAAVLYTAARRQAKQPGAQLLAAGLLRSLRSPWAIALPGLRRSTDWCFVCPPVGAPA